MIMNKKHTILGAFLLLGLVACDPMNDIYNEIDESQGPVVKSGEYTLVAADYTSISKLVLAEENITAEKKAAANAVKSTNTLNELVKAEDYIPALLAKSYADWGKKSTVKVTYAYQDALPETVLEMSKTETYELKDDAYAFVWGDETVVNFLTPKKSPVEYLPKVLTNVKTNAKKGDLVLVDYKYDTEEPTIEVGDDLYQQEFESLDVHDSKATGTINGNVEGWQVINASGTKNWVGKFYNDNRYVQCSAFGATGDNVSWLVGPKTNIVDGASLTFDAKIGYHVGDALHVMVSTTYDGTANLKDEDWEDITSAFKFQNAGNNYTEWYSPGMADLSKYAGKGLYIAFKYVGSATITSTYQLDNVSISTTRMAPTHEKPFNAMYQFDGVDWKPFNKKDVLILTPEDYAAMGITDFGSSKLPENYLPAYLAKMLPYAQIGDVKTLVYKHYDSGSKTVVAEAAEYKLGSDKVWAKNTAVVDITSQFVNVGNGKWIYDPSIYYVISKGDGNLQRIVDYVKETNSTYVDSYGTAEYYYGASEYQGNFNFKVSDRVDRYGKDPELAKITDVEEQAAFMFKRAAEGLCIMLKGMYPDAKSDIDGITLDYYVTFSVYLNPAESGTRNNYTMQFNYDGSNFIHVGDVVKVE